MATPETTDNDNAPTFHSGLSIEEELELCGLTATDLEMRLLQVRQNCADVLCRLEIADPFWKNKSPTQLDFLTRCLRAHDFRVDKAVKVVTSFYEFRTKHNWPFHCRLHDEFVLEDEDSVAVESEKIEKDRIIGANLRKALYSGVHMILPQKDKFGRTVVILRPDKINLNELSLEVYQLMGVFLIQWATGVTKSHEDNDQILTGDIFITVVVDVSELGMKHLNVFGYADIERGIKMWQGTYPLKLRGIYIVNAGTIINGLISLGTNFMDKKLQDRIVAFDTTDEESRSDLHDRLGGEISAIPTSWGGDLVYDPPPSRCSTNSSLSQCSTDKSANSDCFEEASEELLSAWESVVSNHILSAANSISHDEMEDEDDYIWWQDWVSSSTCEKINTGYSIARPEMSFERPTLKTADSIGSPERFHSPERG